MVDQNELAAVLGKIFGGIGEDSLAELVSRVDCADVPGGSTLFHQGDPGDSLYILLRGRLQVVLDDPMSGGEMILGEIAPGEAVGEIGLLTNEPRTASIRATYQHGRATIDGASRFYIPEARRGQIEELMSEAGGRALVDMKVGAGGQVALQRLRFDDQTFVVE